MWTMPILPPLELALSLACPLLLSTAPEASAPTTVVVAAATITPTKLSVEVALKVSKHPVKLPVATNVLQTRIVTLGLGVSLETMAVKIHAISLVTVSMTPVDFYIPSTTILAGDFAMDSKTLLPASSLSILMVIRNTTLATDGSPFLFLFLYLFI